jgi:signal transduction histidine kinase
MAAPGIAPGPPLFWARMAVKLPSLRRRIFGAYALLVAVYAAALGTLSLAAARIDATIFQKMASRNYDSIRAASQIRRDWMERPLSPRTRADMEQQLAFARANVTEPGEAGDVDLVERLWAGRGPGNPGRGADQHMQDALDQLVAVNEQGMKRLADQARRQNHVIMAGLVLMMALTLLLTLLIARRLARSLSRPLIQISDEIGRPRSFEQPLRLPEADSSELEVLRLRLQEWWEQASRKQRERLENEFIGVLSHELKTPLQSLGTAAELMDRKRDRMEPGLHMLLDSILDDLRRIRAVANDFVQVSQLNVRSVRLNLEALDLGAQAAAWLRPFQVLAQERGIELKLETRPGVWCRADRVKFGWVVSNLLSNALRVSHFGQTVTVRVADQQLYAELSVLDEGPGVPLALRDSMFQPYVQGQGPTADRTAGMLGLGLTIAKELVEAHEGAIEYFPGEPRGSVFRVLLPAVARPKEES